MKNRYEIRWIEHKGTYTAPTPYVYDTVCCSRVETIDVLGLGIEALNKMEK